MPPPGVILDIFEHRRRAEGAGSLENPIKFRRQDFHELRQYCLSNRLRFTDATFPPDSSSIGPGILEDHDLARVVWRRPWEMVQNPCLIVHGVSRFDFVQGRVGDCWFLAAIGAMTFQRRVLEQVLPLDQGFEKHYAGIFHFRFWRFGEWVDVVIDDKLPTLDGNLIFVRPSRNNDSEFWAPLLEKAYAKVCGSYTDVKAGSVSEGMMDFTGEAYVGFTLKPAPQYLWDLMERAKKCVSLMGCATLPVKPGEDTELPNGLVAGHAYAVTGVAQVMSRGQPVELVRVWNPWGFKEWNEHWGDKSPLWQTVNEEDRRKCLNDVEDGEFWMSMEHFQEHFCELHICSPSPNFLDDSNCSWTSSTQEGRWVAGVTAGGCTDHTETFWTNPQYLVTVANGPQYTEEQGTPNMLVSVIQKSDKKHRHLATMYRIGFYVFEVPPEFQNSKQQFLASFFNAHAPVTRAFICARGVSKFFCLRSGQYVIVPSTINPNEASGFILKIFSKFNLSVEECCGQPELDVRTLSHSQSYEPENIKNVFSQYRDQYMEINAEKLQKLLNENIIKAQTEGFALDTCRSIVAMMDLSTTGTLDNKEFERLWRKVLIHRDIFLKFDESRSGRLPLSKLWKALQMRGTTVDHTLIHLITSRYSNSFGEISLESFIFLQLRLDYINKTFHMLSKGDGMHLQKKEWQNLAIYS